MTTRDSLWSVDDKSTFTLFNLIAMFILNLEGGLSTEVFGIRVELSLLIL